MDIYAGYQVFGTKDVPCGRAKAELNLFQNMQPQCTDHFVLHFWRENATGDDHCIVVYEWKGELNIGFYADWLGGYLKFHLVPKDHQIEIGGGPNHEKGSREYNSFTWYIHDKTTNEYIEETKETPATWTFKAVDAALELYEDQKPNGLRRSMTKFVALDKDLKPAFLPPLFEWYEWPIPNGCNHHDEIYSGDGYEVECGQWKNIEGTDPFLSWMQMKGGGEGITFDDVIAIVESYLDRRDLGFNPTLNNLIDVVRYYRRK